MAFNSELLKSEIEQSGLKRSYIANKLGITAYGLKLKVDGVNEFKNSEIIKISELLNLDNQARNAIFFAR